MKHCGLMCDFPKYFRLGGTTRIFQFVDSADDYIPSWISRTFRRSRFGGF
jgi:hypothetical protein